jgi:hypothetical protein
MDRSTGSLQAGRSAVPLTEDRIRSVGQTFLGLDPSVPARHDSKGHTRFAVEFDDGQEVGIVYYGADVYPGPAVVDPNAALSMQAAAAHEISHYHRWLDNTELPLGVHAHLDEACTSLDAVLRFSENLSPHEINQLVRDALQRLSLHRADLGA